MAMKQCRECGKMISSGATKCPYCGKSYMGSFRWVLYFCIIMGIIALLAVRK